jgi:hypothetical protein
MGREHIDLEAEARLGEGVEERHRALRAAPIDRGVDRRAEDALEVRRPEPAQLTGLSLGRLGRGGTGEALEARDVSETGLWGYTVEYMRAYGYQMASFEVLRRYLQTITNEDINYGMRHFLSEEDIMHITKREHPEFQRVRFLNPVMLFRILSHLTLARGLRYTAKKSVALIQHNLRFPESPPSFPEWRAGLLRELAEAYQRTGWHD